MPGLQDSQDHHPVIMALARVHVGILKRHTRSTATTPKHRCYRAWPSSKKRPCYRGWSLYYTDVVTGGFWRFCYRANSSVASSQARCIATYDCRNSWKKNDFGRLSFFLQTKEARLEWGSYFLSREVLPQTKDARLGWGSYFASRELSLYSRICCRGLLA